MIVNPKNDGWEIFSHSTHGLLAGKIANEIQDKYKSKNWVATLAAIIEHDDRQLDFDEKNYLTKIGTPRDFLLENRNVTEIVKRSKRLLHQSEEKSSWISMLIAHHLRFIYNDIAKKKKTIADFLRELEKAESHYIKSQNLTEKEVDEVYQILVFADRCSLILCQNAIPAKNRLLEINKSISDKTFWIKQAESSNIQVKPWIFEKDNFTVNAEYKLLENNSFSNNKEFQRLLNESPIRFKNWKFSK
ncbi:DUF3891 family protein [Gillisia hiemivivida]|uniref:DUF3891 family protein n=1 Tax=Gillisia hiemivivida TaxID=291190 RepID=A0A5C6ZSK4_9FLAO|nr:DUF3891 family protein [Gillisia hiemivivida]TXD92149.1 DUF3891 family protein [Gillisia hiemivivida]